MGILAFLIYLFIHVIPLFLDRLSAIDPSFRETLARLALRANPDSLPGIDTLITMRQQGLMSDATYLDTMLSLGYEGGLAESMYQAASDYLAGRDYIRLWVTHQLSEGDLDINLSRLGMSDTTIGYLKQLAKQIPSMSDLVQFATNGAYNSSAITKYGNDKEMPAQFLLDVEQAGLSKDIAQNLWNVHWSIPSLSQLLEMASRNLITADDIDAGMQALNILPYFRDKLKTLGEKLPNLEDIRRMYQTGKLSISDVTTLYQEHGYSAEMAKNLAAFTEAEYGPKTHTSIAGTGLTYNLNGQLVPGRALIMDSYEKGLLDKGQTQAALADIGIPQEAIDLLIGIADATIQQKLIEFESQQYLQDYRAGRITLTQLQAQLTQLGVPPRMLQLTIDTELASMAKHQKEPTRGDLDQWLKRGVIDAQTYTERMSQLGYQAPDIVYYIAEIDQEMSTAKRRYFPYTVYYKFLTSGAITENDLVNLYRTMKYSDTDIANFLASKGLSPPT